jgi:hypothetical protein
MLSPIDIAVAIVIAENNALKFEEMAQMLGISLSKAFGAVQKLAKSGFMLPGSRRVDRLALLEFLEHGIRYVFPAEPGRLKTGVPTAHSGPVLGPEVDDGGEVYVWPSPNGSARGREIVPLVPKASELPSRSPRTYEALSLVDALRVGRARDRKLAVNALRRRFHVNATALDGLIASHNYGDLRSSKDIEDIVALIVSRSTVVADIDAADIATRSRARSFATNLLNTGVAEEVLAAQLNNADDPASAIRLTLKRLREIARLA